MYKQLTILLFFIVQFFSFGQSDTIFYSKKWKECSRNEAKYYRLTEKIDNLFFVRDFYLNSDKIQMTGFYLEQDFQSKTGVFTYYDTLGNISSKSEFKNKRKDGEWLDFYSYTNKLYKKEVFVNDRLQLYQLYYKNGQLKRFEEYKDSVRIKAECYDSLGNEILFFEYETDPVFNGGINEARKYISKNIKYPKKAARKGIEGEAIVVFIVNKEGSITTVKIVQGVKNCSECDNEIIRVIKSMPKWEPAKLDGTPISSGVKLPVKFEINK